MPGIQKSLEADEAAFFARLIAVCDYLATSRPTAVNLFWALDRMREGPRPARIAPSASDGRGAAGRGSSHRGRRPADVPGRSVGMGRPYSRMDRACSRTAMRADWRPATTERRWPCSLLAHETGKRLHVYADETRPLCKARGSPRGSSSKRGIDVTLICDSMAAQVMREGRASAVVTGADRIAANGDSANKIGTYGVALLAAAHDIPFYIASADEHVRHVHRRRQPRSPSNSRDPREITHGFGRATAPEECRSTTRPST